MIAGIFAVDKPLHMSSMRAVEIVRRRAERARTGHAGTLDPLATGVLVLALGRCTRMIESLMATEKRYETRIDLSAFTTTDDSEGERTEVRDAAPPQRHAIEALLRERFTGTIQQRPPAYSAVKLGGRRAYDLARKGLAPTPAPRPVQVHSIDVASYEWPHLDLRIHCGKGTYVRSIARELGQQLGTGGTCLSIRRTMVGTFAIERAVPMDALPERITQAWLCEHGDLPDAPPASAAACRQ
ncbi:MAG: tRNA pseudouridine(55) synthase TruB [Phycisphaerae bacterium]|nr:tRNA pseudouridine(55) synthase TruB [Phycisphaerae bacterium]